MAQADRLQKACKALTEDHYVFKVGDLVEWKEYLKNKNFPEYGEAAVVVEVMDPPVLDPTRESGGPYFREPLGIVIGCFRDDDGLDVWHADARRFRPFRHTNKGHEADHRF